MRRPSKEHLEFTVLLIVTLVPTVVYTVRFMMGLVGN